MQDDEGKMEEAKLSLVDENGDPVKKEDPEKKEITEVVFDTSVKRIVKYADGSQEEEVLLDFGSEDSANGHVVLVAYGDANRADLGFRAYGPINFSFASMLARTIEMELIYWPTFQRKQAELNQKLKDRYEESVIRNKIQQPFRPPFNQRGKKR